MIKKCKHNFDFVRTELIPESLTGANLVEISVSSCSKCGLVVKQPVKHD